MFCAVHVRNQWDVTYLVSAAVNVHKTDFLLPQSCLPTCHSRSPGSTLPLCSLPCCVTLHHLVERQRGYCQYLPKLPFPSAGWGRGSVAAPAGQKLLSSLLDALPEVWRTPVVLWTTCRCRSSHGSARGRTVQRMRLARHGCLAGHRTRLGWRSFRFSGIRYFCFCTRSNTIGDRRTRSWSQWCGDCGLLGSAVRPRLSILTYIILGWCHLQM